jgi:predicted Rossmann fold flavoprotein
MLKRKHIAVIGGGAAGFFTALNIDAGNKASITIFEKSAKLLSKVRVSGGGRCNVTNTLTEPNDLVKNYPRGKKELLGPFHRFSSADTVEWFRSKGVKLKTEDDGRIFPVTDSSETIINCFLELADSKGINIISNAEIKSVVKNAKGFVLETLSGAHEADFLIIASGGNFSAGLQKSLENFGHHFLPPVPSLFTFNVPSNPVTRLMGVSVPMAHIRIKGTNLEETGPVLITHWGFSGPAILRLSAWGARMLAEKKYEFDFSVSWLHDQTVEEISAALNSLREKHIKGKISSAHFELPKRLWSYLLEKAGLDPESLWQEISKQKIRKLAETIGNDTYHARGKTTFKEEFVTCGGVELKEIDFKSMESRILPGLYFAGEVMNIDGITGGFNFQSAWTTAWIGGNDISAKLGN